jgi:hypothetical protein
MSILRFLETKFVAFSPAGTLETAVAIILLL